MLNKDMYKKYMELKNAIKCDQYFYYIENYRQMKEAERRYHRNYDEYGRLWKKMLNLDKYARLTVTKNGEYATVYVINRQTKDDIILYIMDNEVYNGEKIAEMGWRTMRKNGKVVYDDVYYMM